MYLSRPMNIYFVVFITFFYLLFSSNCRFRHPNTMKQGLFLTVISLCGLALAR